MSYVWERIVDPKPSVSRNTTVDPWWRLTIMLMPFAHVCTVAPTSKAACWSSSPSGLERRLRRKDLLVRCRPAMATTLTGP